MNDEFMQLLAVHGFQVCLHGHIHEAIEGFHKYDDRRGVRIIGAGTFGAPAREQVTGIPLQYNLLTFDPETGEMTVQTRKKEKPNGAWSADARWSDKNDPKPLVLFPGAALSDRVSTLVMRTRRVTMAEPRYLEIVRQYPIPTDQQTRELAEYVAGDHSWYEHLQPVTSATGDICNR